MTIKLLSQHTSNRWCMLFIFFYSIVIIVTGYLRSMVLNYRIIGSTRIPVLGILIVATVVFFAANFEIRFKETNGEEERASRRRSISMDHVNDQSNKLTDSMTTITTTTKTTIESNIIVKKTNISLAKSILSYLNGQN